jgi:hypothetical protein
MIIRGDRLNAELRAEVLRAYIYRWTSENEHRLTAWHGIKSCPTMPLISDAQWLREHAFRVTVKGHLDQRRRHALPACLATDAGGL